MKRKFLLFLLIMLGYSIAAENQNNGRSSVTKSYEINLQVSTLPEIKLGFVEQFKLPFLQGTGSFTKDNNISFSLGTEISPVSLNETAETVWTPIAFFQLAAGGRVGTGWNIRLFGSDVYGSGISMPDSSGETRVSGNGFDGLLYKVQGGAVLQADLAAIVPGDWNHLVMRSYHEINYRGYTRAAKNESWYYENDDGENCNGANYYGNLLLGYQMPIILDLAALLAEGDLYLYDTPNRSLWGDDRIRWTFSAILDFSITPKLGAALITQLRTRRNFIESNWEDLYYRNRTLDTSSPIHLEFRRVAAVLSYKF